MARIGLRSARRQLGQVFERLHAKRVLSLANGAVGLMQAPRAAIHAIGAGYAAAAGTDPKHGIKQVDRYLSNEGISVEALLPAWAKFVLAGRKKLLIALDWTEFAADDHATLAAYVVTKHGRATPLAWLTVERSTLAGQRTQYEFQLVERLQAAIPREVEIELLADRGFGSQKLYEELSAYGWDYTIRFRGTIVVAHQGETKPAKAWLSSSGRAVKLVGARVTRDRTEVGAVVLVHQRRMKEPWFLVTSQGQRSAAETVQVYGRRFTVEETFRDQKDLRFGLGLSATHIDDPGRRDRFLLLLAIAQALLTLLGEASERAGLDRCLKANTVKRRTHSLFRQGVYWYSCLETMRQERWELLMKAYAEVLAERTEMTEILGAI